MINIIDKPICFSGDSKSVPACGSIAKITSNSDAKSPICDKDLDINVFPVSHEGADFPMLKL